MNAQVAAYLREDKLIIVPQGGGGGYFFDIAPVYVVPPDDDSANSAVTEALRASAACELLEPPGTGRYRSPVLAAANVRSWKAFYRGATYCFMWTEDGQLYLQEWVPAPDGRGLEPGMKPALLIDDPRTAGAAALSCLRAAPLME